MHQGDRQYEEHGRPPHKQVYHTAASIPKTPQPGRTGYIPPPQPNAIADKEGLRPANFQHRVHRSPSGPHTIPPEVHIPLPRVKTVKPPRVDMGGHRSNLISIGNKKNRPQYAFTVQCQKKIREENLVTNKISEVAQEYRRVIKGPERKIWEISFANKLGHLAQGIREVKGTNKVMFIPKFKVPKVKKVTYGKTVCEMKTEKEDKERTILTLGENFLDFTVDISAPTSLVTTSQCVFNSVVSTPGARYLLVDIKHFHLNNILPDPKFMWISLDIFPQDIIDTYELKALVDEQGWIYMRIENGMYGLK